MTDDELLQFPEGSQEIKVNGSMGADKVISGGEGDTCQGRAVSQVLELHVRFFFYQSEVETVHI